MDPVLNSLNEVEGLMSTFKEELADIGCHIHLGRGNTILRQKTERQSIDRLIMDQRDRLNKKTKKEYIKSSSIVCHPLFAKSQLIRITFSRR